MPIVGQRAPLPVLPTSAPEPPAAPAESAPPPAEAAAEQQISPKFAALARKEKELRRQQQEIKAQKDALESERTKYEKDYIPKSRLTQNTLEVLMEQGLSHDQIAQMLLNAPSQADQSTRQLEAKIKAIEEAQETATKSAQERQKKDYDAALNQIREDAVSLIDSNEQYETIKEKGAHEAVVELIQKTFEETGKLLTIEAAANQVEEFLLEDAVKSASLKKVQARLLALKESQAPAAPQKPTLQEKLKQQPPAPLKTLTNAQTATSSRRLTAEERKQRAILAFKNQLPN